MYTRFEFPNEDIWFQWKDDDGNLVDATWCNDKIYKYDIPYRRKVFYDEYYDSAKQEVEAASGFESDAAYPNRDR